MLGDGLAHVLWGPLTAGVTLLGLHALILMGAALWYDRACSRHSAPLPDGPNHETRVQR